MLGTLLGGTALAWPLDARAQQPDRARRIGVLMAVAESDQDVRSGVATFRQRLEELGWSEGRNLRIDYRWGGADAGRIKTLAKELIDLSPDVLVGHSTPSVAALRQETRSTPIVFLSVTDPVGQGSWRVEGCVKPSSIIRLTEFGCVRCSSSSPSWTP